MKSLSAFGLVLIFLVSSFAQENVIELRNGDVLSMLAAKVPADVIINRIETSRCYFDTFPTVISELRYKGVSEEILIAMVAAPIGRPTRKENTRSESPRKNSATVLAREKPERANVTNAVSSAQTDKKPSDSAEVQNKSAGPTAASSYSVGATEQVLTNDDLIKLLRGGTPAPDIVKRVKSAKGNYDFSGKALFALQQAGADATVFLSMMEASRAVQNEQKEREAQNNPAKSPKP
jgi:molybdopterin-guanine dinucleotide biosynthesis protein